MESLKGGKGGLGLVRTQTKSAVRLRSERSERTSSVPSTNTVPITLGLYSQYDPLFPEFVLGIEDRTGNRALRLWEQSSYWEQRRYVRYAHSVT